MRGYIEFPRAFAVMSTIYDTCRGRLYQEKQEPHLSPGIDCGNLGTIMSQTLGQRVMAARVRIGMSMRQLAIKSGLSRDHLYRIQRGETDPQGGTLEKIAEALGISVEDALGAEPADSPPSPTEAA